MPVSACRNNVCDQSAGIRFISDWDDLDQYAQDQVADLGWNWQERIRHVQ